MCAICDLDIALGVAHPLTLPVAVATRAAIEKGLLTAPPIDPPGALGSLRARTRAIEALRSVQARLERTLAQDRIAALPDFFVLIVETGTWGHFRPTPAGFDQSCRPGAPRLAADDARDRDAVVVMSEFAARHIAEGALGFEAAQAEGLIAIDADDARLARLLAAFRDAWPVSGFSRFVCA